MTTSYPGAFDTFADAGTNLSSTPNHSVMHNNVQDAVEAIEAELGLNPSGSSATVAARFSAIEAIVPYVQVTRSAAQLIATNTNTVVTWDTEAVDTDSIHSTSSNTSRLTVPTGKGGTWLVGFTVQWIGSGGAIAADTSTFAAWIQANGNSSTRYCLHEIQGVVSGAIPLQLAAGDYVEVGCFQNTGSGVNFVASVNDRFWATRLGN
jgi:hypothetical protein